MVILHVLNTGSFSGAENVVISIINEFQKRNIENIELIYVSLEGSIRKRLEKEKIKYFSLRDNGLKCEICGKQDKSAVEISEGTLNAIKYAILAPAKKLYSFKVSEESIRELKIISKLYLNDKLDKEYKI